MNIALRHIVRPTARALARTLVVALASMALVGAAQAQGRGSHGGGHYGHGGGGYHRGGGGPGWVLGGVGLGLGLGLASYYASYPWYGYGYGAGPGYVMVDPPVVYTEAPRVYSAPVPARGTYPQQPVVYPRNGQSAAQTDADANACSQWSGQQPNATADASVFQRGIAACMDARGYTVR